MVKITVTSIKFKHILKQLDIHQTLFFFYTRVIHLI